MNRIARPGFTRADLTASLFVTVAALCVLLPACSKSRTSEQETESKNNLKDLGDANTKRDDRGDPNPIRAAAGRKQSENNLRQMGLSMHGIASRNDGRLPPVVGVFPVGGPVNASIFFHMLSDIEQDNVYKQYMNDPSSCKVVIKTFMAPLDPSNDGKQPLTSYASNAAVFGIGGNNSAAYPSAFNTKGTSNTILFMERFAVTQIDGKTNAHLWPASKPAHVNYIYDVGFPAPLVNLPDPIFGATPGTVTKDDTAHSFSADKLQVVMADSSARTISSNITAKNVISTPLAPFPKDTISVWTWACLINGPVGVSPTPPGW
jgi:hypothetical protein